MKTKRNFSVLANLKTYMVLPMIAIAIIALSSCGKNKNTVPDPETVYTQVDVMPVFNGGDTAILNFIARNTIYPAEAKTKAIQGRVVVKLVVEKDGSVSHVEILKSVDPLLDTEAVRVVSTLPKFEKPGILNGKPVAVNYMIPITFTLK
jgi:periplasmic protein TonB